MIADRQIERERFLANTPWADAKPATLAGDASNRRYFRLSNDRQRIVLMDAPPAGGEDIRPFLDMTRWLRQHGLSAPEMFEFDADTGFLLLEDLGDDLFARVLDGTQDAEHDLYAAAVDLLVDLSRIPPPDFIAPYDAPVLDREARLFVEWWLPAVTGCVVDETRQAEFSHLIRQATHLVEPCRDVTVLRDYHAENLVWLPERAGISRVGLLDYQDALAGHPAYDLMSLLEDARRDTSEKLRAAMIERYLRARPDLEPEAFLAAYSALGAQRNLKIIGIFARLGLRDGKPRYLSLIPRVWAHLQRDLSHPALGDLQAWVRSISPAPDAETLSAVADRCPA